MEVWDQILTIASADTIVAPFGAGLTNLVFARPGTRVVEIYNHDLNPRLGIPYERICRAAGLVHLPLLGIREEAQDNSIAYRIPEAKLRELLAAIHHG